MAMEIIFRLVIKALNLFESFNVKLRVVIRGDIN